MGRRPVQHAASNGSAPIAMNDDELSTPFVTIKVPTAAAAALACRQCLGTCNQQSACGTLTPCGQQHGNGEPYKVMWWFWSIWVRGEQPSSYSALTIGSLEMADTSDAQRQYDAIVFLPSVRRRRRFHHNSTSLRGKDGPRSVVIRAVAPTSVSLNGHAFFC
jgi:hypothetical protein